jgi:hypothetical protein
MLALMRTDTRRRFGLCVESWRLAVVAVHRRHRLTLCRDLVARCRRTSGLAPDVDERGTDRLEMTRRCVVFPTQETHNLSHAVHAAFSKGTRVSRPQLSGGEAQRVKFAKKLRKRGNENTVKKAKRSASLAICNDAS